MRRALSGRLRPIVWFGMLCGVSMHLGAETPAPVMPDFTPVAWLPAVSLDLTKVSVPTEGIVLAGPDVRPQKGDTVTVLVQAIEKNRLRQWAVVLSINDIKPEEQKLRTPAFSLYLSNGRQIDFAPSPLTGILIHVFGPYARATGGAGAKDLWSGSLVSPQFLGLGLDGTAALLVRISRILAADASLRNQPFSFDVGGRPFPPDRIARERAQLEPFQVTASEERAYAGFMPAMTDFFRIASQTPGVREILFKVLDLPWWSIATHGGRITEVNFDLSGPFDALAPEAWGLPAEARVYSMGFRLLLYGKPALNCRLALTAPRVPLLNSAGLIGLAVMRPNGKGPRLMIRVMAARPAAPSAN